MIEILTQYKRKNCMHKGLEYFFLILVSILIRYIFTYHLMVISFQRQLQEDDNNAITAEYDLYSDDDEYDSIDRQGKADEGRFDFLFKSNHFS